MKLARKLNTVRSQRKELSTLSHDPWILVNSDIEPQKLHALGAISFRWNLSEQKLLQLFGSILNCSVEEAHVLAHEVGALALIARIKVLASTRLKDDDKLVSAITNVLDVYDVCRKNRNQLTHFDLTLVSETRPWTLALARKSRSPEYRKSEPFPDTIKDLRRVARDVRRLNAQLYLVERCVFRTYNPSSIWREPLPDKLPIPELLWKPPPRRK
jgi:hypothetical protein